MRVHLPITIFVGVPCGFISQFFICITLKHVLKTEMDSVAQEQELLRTMGGSNLKNKWTHIAKLINDLLPAVQRTAKQCREKYNNHLIFGNKSYDGNWTQSQDEILFAEYKEKGPRWKNISESFPNKSQNTIKNRFYGNVRKIVRKLNKIGKQKISKSFKPIRQKSIIRIIEPDTCLPQLSESVFLEMRNLREKLLELIKLGMEENEEQEDSKIDHYVRLIQEIHSFNCSCRFYRNFKPRSQRKMPNIKRRNNENAKNSTDVHNQGSQEAISKQSNEESDQMSGSEALDSAKEAKKSQSQENYPQKAYSSQKQIRSKEILSPNPPKNVEILEQKLKQLLKKPSGDNFIPLMRFYLAQYCLVYDKQCLHLLASSPIQ